MTRKPFITIGLLSACLLWPSRSKADTVEAVVASNNILQSWDVFTFVINTSSSPISVAATIQVVESPADFSILTSPPAVIDPNGGPPIWKKTLQPGESTLITGLVKELVGLSQHVHMIADFTGDSVEHHTGGLQYFEFLLDTNGDVVQYMGPAPHSTTPTPTAPPPTPDPSCYDVYAYLTASVGYPTQLGYRDIVIVRNGPNPNNLTVWEDYLELPAGSAAGPFFSSCHNVGALAPGQVAVVNIPNTTINWAHHSQAFVNTSDPNISWTHLYVDDFGQIYGSESNGPYGTVGANPYQQVFMPAAQNFSPADTTTNVSRQPTFSWTPPDPATFPTGVTTVTNYTVTVSSTTGDPSQTDVVKNVNLDPSACTPSLCSLTWPDVLAPSQFYYWRITYYGVGPITPGPATGNNAGLPGIGGGVWLTGGTNPLTFTTSP